MSASVLPFEPAASARQVPDTTRSGEERPVTIRADQRPAQPCDDLSAAHVPCSTIRLAPSTSAHEPCAAFGRSGSAWPDQLPWKVRNEPAVAVQDPRKTGGDCWARTPAVTSIAANMFLVTAREEAGLKLALLHLSRDLGCD